MSENTPEHEHLENDDPLRDLEELIELKRTQVQVIKQRDLLAAEEADLLATMEELEAAKASMRQMMDGLQEQMQGLQKEVEETEELRYRATHDALTGLWNRGAILDVLKRELVRAQREGISVGVLLGDLDHFKSVNDTHGHLAGDAVLRESAQRISAAVRSYDSVGRYGDDYFLIVLSGCEDEIDMLTQAERIRWAVCMEPVLATEGSIPITVSIGGTTSAGLPDVEAVIRAADAALYRAKRAGGNRVESA